MPFCWFGDFSLDPALLAGFIAALGAVAVVPADGMPTCGNAVLDLFVVAQHLSLAIQESHLDQNAGFGPHKPFKVGFHGQLDALTVRKLTKPKDPT